MIPVEMVIGTAHFSGRGAASSAAMRFILLHARIEQVP